MTSQETVAVRRARPSGTLVLEDGREVRVGRHNAKYLPLIKSVQTPRRTVRVLGVLL